MRSKLLKSMTSVIGTLAIAALVAGGALAHHAEGGKPTMRGNYGVAWGQKTISAPGFDATKDDIEGFHGAIESNLYFNGSDGPMDYEIRLRFRGRDNQNEEGDKSLFDDGKINVIRGHVGWNFTDAFRLQIGKKGGSPHAGTTENDPIQLFPCSCFNIGGTDNASLELVYKAGGQEFGVYIIPGSPIGMSTNGKPLTFKKFGGALTGDNNALGIIPWYFGRFGGFGIGLRVGIASADVNGTVDDLKGGCKEFDAAGACIDFNTKSTGIKAESFDSTGFATSIEIPLGALGKIAVDFDTITSDLALGTVDSTTALVSESDFTYVGVLLYLGGLRAGFGQAEEEVGADTLTRTNISVHYRFPITKKVWWAPEFQQQTSEDSTKTGAGTDDIVEQAVRFLMQFAF